MLKVLLVDDERNVCTLLRNLINWSNYGFEIIGEAHDGDSAYEITCRERPDILITDIKLPGISGLELVDRIRNSDFSPFIILISGHQKFEYAHTAIKYGVENYLLKPISKQDLIDNLLNIRDKIFRQEKEAAIEQVADLTQQKLRHQFLSLLAFSPSHIEGKSFSELNSEYALHLCPGYIRILTIKEDFFELLPATQIKIIESKILEITEKQLSPVCFDMGGIALNGSCLFFLNPSETQETLSVCLHSILTLAQEYCSSYCHLTLGLGGAVSGFSLSATESSREAIAMRMLLGCNSVYFPEDTEKGHTFALSQSDITQMCRDVEIWDSEQILFDMKALLYQYDLSRSNPLCLIRESKSLLEAVRATLKKMYDDADLPIDPSSVIIISQPLEDSTSSAKYWNTLAGIIKDSLSSFLSIYEAQKRGLISQAKEFIRMNYQTEIALEQVAAHVHMSSSYFSSVFKKEEGITFIKYLTNFRLNKAKTLLKDTQHNIGEIANLVGYGDTKYFTKLFKKEVGLKPSEYRKLYTKGRR